MKNASTMITKTKQVDTRISGLKDKCWALVNIVRGELSPREYYLILYLITLFKNGIDLNVTIRKTQSKIEVELPVQDIETSTNPFKRDLKKLTAIHSIFLPSLEKLSFEALEKISSVLKSAAADVDKNFSEMFDLFLYEISGLQGKMGGEHIQPKELSRFVCELVNLPEKAKVYNPFAGVASFGIFLNGSREYLGQEINQTSWAIGSMRLMAHNVENNSTLQLGDSINHWNPTSEKYDLILANPPFGMRLSQTISSKFGSIKTSDNFLFEKGIDDLKSDGKLIAVIPNRFLFSLGEERSLRLYLIENDLLEMVISFPGGLLFNTGIPVSIIVINKDKKEKGSVRFIDAKKYIVNVSVREKRFNDLELNRIVKTTQESESLRIVSNVSIKESDYNLSVNRYFTPDLGSDDGEGSKWVKLKELVSVVRGQRAAEDGQGKFVRIRNLKEDKLDYNLDLNTIEEREGKSSAYFFSKMISESCLLLATRWKTFKPTYFNFADQPILVSADILALKVDETKVNIGYLINELNSDYVIEQAETFRTGTVIPTLRKDDLLNIKIKLPSYHNQQEYEKSLKEQKAKVQGALEAILADKKKEMLLFQKIHGLESEIVEQKTYLRHTLAGPASNLIGSITNIRKIIENKVLTNVPEIMTLKLSDKHKITFGQYLEIIERDIKKISEAVSKQLEVETGMESKSLVPIDIIEFLTKYANEFLGRKDLKFEIEFSYDQAAFLDNNGKLIITYIIGNHDLLTDLFDNLVSNAIAHAFNIEGSHRIEIYLMKFPERERQEDITILFSNTGKPFPEHATKQDYIRKGFTVGPHAGDGFGGWYINEIIERLNGNFDIIDETGGEGLLNSDLVTSIEINFPIIESDENEPV